MSINFSSITHNNYGNRVKLPWQFLCALVRNVIVITREKKKNMLFLIIIFYLDEFF